MKYKDEFQKLVSLQRYSEAMQALEKGRSFRFEDSFYFSNMGWIYNRLEQYQNASFYLEKGLQYFPDDAWIYTQLGYTYNRLQRYQEACNLLEKGIALGHHEAFVYYELGYAHKKLGHLEKALQIFEDALLEEPDNTWILAQAAFLYRDLGNFTMAEEYLRKVWEMTHDDDAVYDLAMLYKSMREYEKELEVLQQGNQNDAFFLFEQAFAYNRLQQFEIAASLCEKCLQLDYDHTGVRKEFGYAYWHLQKKELAILQYEKAYEYLTKALQNDQGDAYMILREMFEIAVCIEDVQKQETILQKAYAKFPKDTWVLYEYASFYANKNEWDVALRYCEQCLQEDAQNAETMFLKAWLLGKKHLYAEANAILYTLEKNGDANFWLYYELGWNLSELEEYEQAITAYLKCYAIDETHIGLLSQLGWNYGTLKKHEEALKYLLEAEEKGRQDGWIYANLAWNYAMLQDKQKQRYYCQKANDLGYQEGWFLRFQEDEQNKQ